MSPQGKKEVTAGLRGGAAQPSLVAALCQYTAKGRSAKTADISHRPKKPEGEVSARSIETFASAS
jgi:hypothetical protein